MSQTSATAPVRTGTAATPVFAATVFLSAVLLFLVQPMASKALLPGFGGGAAVWTAVMLFFQAAMLAGGALVHATTGRLGAWPAAGVHLGLSLGGLLLVPGGGAPRPAATGLGPAPDVLATLALAYGPAMVAMGGNAALLQHWYARATGREPYRLYALSNAGSMLGLAAYPLLLEPWLPLRLQGWTWTLGYALCIAGLAACAAIALGRGGGAGGGRAAPARPGAAAAATRPAEALRWVALAFIPSSVLLGATQHVTTQVAPLPLLWVLPLAVYLGTWTAAFAAPEAQARRGRAGLAAAMALLVGFGVVPGVGVAFPTTGVVLHLLALAAVGLLCHGRLALLRPEPARLTTFYLCLSLGGMLGGVANAVLAPLVLDRPLEYPLSLAAACLAAPGALRGAAAPRRLLAAAAAAAPAAAIVGMLALQQAGALAGMGVFAVPAVVLAAVLLVLAARMLSPPAFALAVLVALAAPLFGGSLAEFAGARATRLVASDRDFYGAIRVLDSADWRRLNHGEIAHGQQWRAPERRREMTLYYHPEAGAGRLIAALRAARAGGPEDPPLEVAAVGLGAGVMACYAGPDLRIAFLEISPAVAAAARRHFSFLAECGEPPVEIGDGRLLLAARPPRSLDLIVLDAYSGGAIPVHTATAEAIAGYLARLRPGGALAFHVSNKHFDLAPFVAAAAARQGARALEYAARAGGGGGASVWVAVTQDRPLAERLREEGWVPLDGGAVRPWEDDRWDLLRALRRAPWAPGEAARLPPPSAAAAMPAQAEGR